MELIYTGKTKDVYKLESGNYLLKFKDDMTGKDGVFDPGANEVGLSIEGMGKTNLLVTDMFFEKLSQHKIPTHKVESNLEESTMTVKNCTPFGKGIEVIYRNFAVGSFIRRYGLYAEEMMPLKDYVEITLKDDKRQDPLITKEGLIALGILSEEEYKTLVELTIKISNLVTEILKEKGLQLIDIKLEYGKTDDGQIVLMDEMSAGNMRVYRDGKSLDPQETSRLILA
ncbi:MAG: phosphoribosylaminoimidazolesuccinocarboxamide synthase [Tissierellia bacterium]|nr:phosphoribosylaminoimidazolesuccinocarboxamide synthase [Tissierellia bacterium]